MPISKPLQKKAVQHAAFDKFIDQIDDRPRTAYDTDLAIAPDLAPGCDRRKGERCWNLESGIGMAEEADRSRDTLEWVYEYFLGRLRPNG